MKELRQYSPTLDKDMKDLEAQGWKIQYCDQNGKPCDMFDRKNKVLSVSRYFDAKGMVHEIGHLKKHIAGSIANETEQVTYNAMIRKEILNNGGPDIGIRGRREADYIRLYDDLESGKIKKPEYDKELKELFCRYETYGNGQRYSDVPFYPDCKE